jgi:REP element-mobilizing transposase RayT
MPQSLSQVLIHIVFSTKNRFPFLGDHAIRSDMHAYLGGACNRLECPCLTVGGVADHVHILCALSRNHSISEILADIKRESSKWVKTKGTDLAKFAWQNGYGVFSVSRSHVQDVSRYIREQEEHHRKKTFQEEYREFLEKHGVEYDERYLWD